jgi:hypothetical protein
MKAVNGKAAALAATVAAAAIGWAGPAQAAATTIAGPFQVSRNTATASGNMSFRAGWPGSYSVTGTLTVSENDGQCYYVRYYVRQSLLGTGINSARQCGRGSLPLAQNLSVGYGVILGLCSTAPNAPEEAPFISPGTNCTIA